MRRIVTFLHKGPDGIAISLVVWGSEVAHLFGIQFN